MGIMRLWSNAVLIYSQIICIDWAACISHMMHTTSVILVMISPEQSMRQTSLPLFWWHFLQSVPNIRSFPWLFSGLRSTWLSTWCSNTISECDMWGSVVSVHVSTERKHCQCNLEGINWSFMWGLVSEGGMVPHPQKGFFGGVGLFVCFLP